MSVTPEFIDTLFYAPGTRMSLLELRAHPGNYSFGVEDQESAKTSAPPDEQESAEKDVGSQETENSEEQEPPISEERLRVNKKLKKTLLGKIVCAGPLIPEN